MMDWHNLQKGACDKGVVVKSSSFPLLWSNGTGLKHEREGNSRVGRQYNSPKDGRDKRWNCGFQSRSKRDDR